MSSSWRPTRRWAIRAIRGGVASGNNGDMSALRRLLLSLLALAVLAVIGCSFTGNTLGRREKCWPQDQARAASLWRGILRIDSSGGRLETPEGDVIPLLSGALQIRIADGGVGQL